MMKEKLEPCPFCGGEAILFPVYGKAQFGYWIACRNCDIEQPQFKTKEAAIIAWNKRSDKIPVGNGENYEVTHNV